MSTFILYVRIHVLLANNCPKVDWNKTVLGWVHNFHLTRSGHLYWRRIHRLLNSIHAAHTYF